MTLRSAWVWWLLLGLLLGTPACPSMGMGKSGRMKSFLEVARNVEQGYRWKDFERIRSLLDPQLQARFQEQFMVAGNDLVISDTERSRIEFKDPEAREAVLLLSIQWHRLPSITELVSGVQCTFRNENGQWRLIRQEELGRDGTGLFDL